MPRILTDDLGHPVELPGGPVQRVVSLVPSLTEAIAATRLEALVGVTDWCTHPADLDVTRVRGTKNPDRAAILELAPELVVVVQEENRELDVRRLREAGVPVWVAVIESVPQSLQVMRQLFTEVLGWGAPGWLEQVEGLWGSPELPPVRASVAVPIWRDPWMVVGARNFTTDLLARAGLRNVNADHEDRYPHVEVADLDAVGADVVLLPDEPYEFTADDGPEAFAATPTQLISGRLITWYGPAMLEAWEALSTIEG
ncbi:helical backbone metal receptor [Ornithinimicrobium ciconiae]|uniref:helical backbone metal receptor n=1 Tax=Ornithinimicrobium ciconiae TaxID=2594265 RepID=UPI00192D9F8F|nr:helical backbone metal receptor [Ornithinimicrobium ciconiae]